MPKNAKSSQAAPQAALRKFFLALVPTGAESNKAHLQFSVVGRPCESKEEAEKVIDKATNNPASALVVTVEVPE